ncbi:putative Na+/H+ antiporter [Acinetobacter haemolyticus CIP 64.3 = MTCC 9819]|nr:putative Na+/H+ antiporter [Acinetobacter haemolyticus CIP 64.3 = MTCC 9819]
MQQSRLGLPAVMNAFYYNPNEATNGLKGLYQRICKKMNRRGFKYIVGEDSLGRETITIYNPEVLLDQKMDDGVATMHHPNKREEVRRLENPDNF